MVRLEFVSRVSLKEFSASMYICIHCNVYKTVEKRVLAAVASDDSEGTVWHLEQATPRIRAQILLSVLHCDFFPLSKNFLKLFCWTSSATNHIRLLDL